jgi:hypothetical protein
MSSGLAASVERIPMAEYVISASPRLLQSKRKIIDA